MLMKTAIVLLILGVILIALAGPVQKPWEQFCYSAGQACLTIATLLGTFFVLGSLRGGVSV